MRKESSVGWYWIDVISTEDEKNECSCAGRSKAGSCLNFGRTSYVLTWTSVVPVAILDADA